MERRRGEEEEQGLESELVGWVCLLGNFNKVHWWAEGLERKGQDETIL